jgi:putative membrane protein
LRQVIGLNLLALPWYLIPEFQLLAIPLILIASYFLIGMELIAEDVEEPFGRGGDDLPLDKICATIKASVHEILQIST